jgi:hypothetical protein
MQIWQPGYDVRDDGDYAVTLNPGNGTPFAIIELSGDGRTALIVQSPEEADRLFKAAVKAKRLLAPAESAPGYRLACGCTDWCNCDRCRAGKAHQPGAGWHCDKHGRTEVAQAVAA